MLMLDGATQITSRDEYVYQEMMSHVPLFAHGRARDVLIVGGGDCGIAEEVLKHKIGQAAHPGRDRRLGGRIRQAALPRIHRAGVRRQALRMHHRRRHEIRGRDPAPLRRRSSWTSTDPQGRARCCSPGNSTPACKRCLNKGGVLVTQNGVPFLQADELKASIGHFSALFADATCYLAAVPTYVGGHMAMGFASDDKRLRTHLRAAVGRAPPQGRAFRHPLLDPGIAGRRLRAAALHRRTGGRGAQDRQAGRRR